jgi:threonine/homoserine/homoserine lactone efflux protein
VETSLYLAFIGVSIAVIVIPGPSILLIVSNSLQFGTVPGLYTVAGISVAMLIQLAVVLVGLTSLVANLAQGLGVIQWLGITYLGYLGFRRLWQAAPSDMLDTSEVRRYGSAFAEGFLVSLTNPTTLLFFIAFFPQFLSATISPVPQLVLMSVTFWGLALFFDVAYAGLSARISHVLRDPKRAVIRSRLSGAIMLAAAVALVLARI